MVVALVLPILLVGIARGIWRCRIGADTSTYSEDGSTGGHRCRPNVVLRLLAIGGVRETSSDIPSICGVTRFRSVSMAMLRRWVVAGSVGGTASGSRFQGGGAESGGGFANERVTTPSPSGSLPHRVETSKVSQIAIRGESSPNLDLGLVTTRGVESACRQPASVPI
jgi:hypothetical protein